MSDERNEHENHEPVVEDGPRIEEEGPDSPPELGKKAPLKKLRIRSGLKGGRGSGTTMPAFTA